MELNGTFIDDTFAEAFGMRYARLIVTAADEYWLDAALREFTGYSSSVIACDAETGVERRLSRRAKRPTAGPARRCWCSASRPTPWPRACPTASASA